MECILANIWRIYDHNVTVSYEYVTLPGDFMRFDFILWLLNITMQELQID